MPRLVPESIAALETGPPSQDPNVRRTTTTRRCRVSLGKRWAGRGRNGGRLAWVIATGSHEASDQGHILGF